MNEHVWIRELAPREGFQILPQVVPASEKLQLIQMLVAARLPELEVTSFVRADLVPQLGDSNEIVAKLSELFPAPPPILRALALNPRGFELALAAPRLSHEAWFYSGLSDTFLNRNMNTNFARQLKQIEESWAPLWKGSGNTRVHVMLSNAFGCAYEGTLSLEQLLVRWNAIRDAIQRTGCDVVELSLADTVGMGTATTVQKAVERLRDDVLQVSLHLHDTTGHALECADAGLSSGVRIFESSVAGLGGCPFTRGAAGNIATEKLVGLLSKRGFTHGVDMQNLESAATFARALASRYGSS